MEKSLSFVSKSFGIFKTRFAWNVISLTCFNTVGRVGSFVIPFLIALWFGVSSETDAFFLVYSIVIFISGVFAPTLESVIVPFIVEIKNSSTEDRALARFLFSVLLIAVSAVLLLGVVAAFFLEPSLRIIAHFSGPTLDTIFYYFIEVIPLMILSVVTSFFAGIFNAYSLFWLPGLSLVLKTLTTILFIAVFKQTFGVNAVVLGFLAGEFSRFLFLFLAAVRKRIIVLTHVVFKLNRNILVFLRSSFFQITGTLAMALNPIVNRIMASWLGSGTISLLEYSERIYQIPVGLFLYGFLAVLLSHWSDGFYSQDKDIREFRKRVIGIVRATAAVGLLSALALFLFRAPIVQLLYGYGRIPERHLPVIADLLAIYLIGLAPFVIGLVFTRAFMVLKHMRVFLIFGVVNFASNIVLNLFLIGPLGIYAFAASTTLISFMVAFGLHFYLVRYELSYEHAC